MGFFPTLFALEKKISSLAKCLLRGVMKLLEKGSGPVRAVKLLGQFCQDFTTNTALASAIRVKKPACF